MKIPALLLFAISVTVAANCQPGNGIDVLHYSFQINLSDSSDLIAGKAGIQVSFTKATDYVSFDLASVKDGKGMTVSSVTENNKTLQATQRDNKLVIQLPAKVNPGDTSTFIVNYTGIPSDGLIISKNKYKHRTFFADNWPDRGHNWIPCHDDPADKAPVEFIVTAPQHYQVVANGIQTEETNLENNLKLTHWKEDVPVATKVMVIGAADFAVNLSGVVDCIPVYSWVYPEDRDKGFYDYGQAKDILPFFISHAGPYGYKKLANVESKTIFGGLENASAIFYYENSITGTRKSESLLTHEIAHQWFGNMATEKSFAHLWLSEGFATYFTILYFENKYGLDTALYMLKQDRREVIAFSKENNHPVVDTTIKDYMQLLNANNYQKGGWILHMLRRQLGDTIFWKSIRDYYATYAGKNADTHDLQVIFEKHSGQNLDAFFRQWLYTPGQPSLNITWKPGTNKKLHITVSQLQGTLFSFPLEVEIKTVSGKTKLEKLNITRKEETFVLSIAEEVVSIVADPNTSLLFEGKINRAN
ncbi:MAG: M1 family aminopeptidase [Bacteroidota bacterium]